MKGFLLFWYDFIVGDDATVAIGVVLALGVTALLAHAAHVPAWWVLPVATVVLLAGSLWRATRAARSAAKRPG